MTDLEQAGLRGPVRMCCIEQDSASPDHHWVMHTTDMFSPEGNLLERRHRNPDGSLWSMACRYDGHGRIREKQHPAQDPGVEELFSYQYDVLGRLDRVILHLGKEGERVFESWQYAGDGTRTHTAYPAPLDDEQRKTTGVLADSMLHLSLDAVAIMTVFDVSGRPTRKVLYDVDERVIRRVTFRYDTRGLLVEEGELVGGRVVENFRNLYRYDASGRRIEADKRWGDLGGSRTAFTYDERGNMTEERIGQWNLLAEDPAAVESWTNRFSYRYDDAGNWTERLAETVRSNGEVSVSAIERREIAYY